jgi:hypothetical protein
MGYSIPEILHLTPGNINILSFQMTTDFFYCLTNMRKKIQGSIEIQLVIGMKKSSAVSVLEEYILIFSIASRIFKR